MTGLTFEPISHRYELDGVRVPSVTGVLRASGLVDFSAVPPPILERARIRGTTVHEAIAALNENDLDLEAFYRDFDEESGYLRGWETFLSQRCYRPLLNEVRVASRRHQVAGTIDTIGTLDGVAVILDYATGSAAASCKRLQLAGYEYLAREWASDEPLLTDFFVRYPYVKRYAVELHRDGSFRLEPYTDPGDFREFVTLRSALAIREKYRGVATPVEVG